MQKTRIPKIQISIIILIIALVFSCSGCIQNNFESEMQKYNELRNRFNLNEEIAPAEKQQITEYKAGLNTLKKKSADQAFIEFIEIQINAAETAESLFAAELELQRVNTVDVDCTAESPLNKGIALLENAANKSDLAERRIEIFKTAYPTYAEQTSTIETRIKELNSSIKDQLASAQELKIISCT